MTPDDAEELLDEWVTSRDRARAYGDLPAKACMAGVSTAVLRELDRLSEAEWKKAAKLKERILQAMAATCPKCDVFHRTNPSGCGICNDPHCSDPNGKH